jgi:amino acid adenylation domain-containing protein/FkbM family methyltransferase
VANVTPKVTPNVTKPNAQDIQSWSLSPLQEALLYFTLERPEQHYYIEQVVLRLAGVGDDAPLVRAWQRTVSRHAILRSAVAWGPRGAPVQVIADELALPVTRLDARAASASEAAAQLDELLARDRRSALDVLHPPALRVALIQGAGGETTMTVTFHHLVLDGWSLAVVLKDVLAEVARPTSGPVREAPPYGDYIRWLQAQDPALAEAFWRRQLHGLVPSNALADLRRAGAIDAGDLPIAERRSISASALHELARRLGLTPNTIAQAAWALLLSRHGGARDLVFGQAVSDRPAAIAGIEAIAGPCIHTLPIRVRVDPQATVASWLRALQQHHVQVRQHAHCSLQQLVHWAGLAPGTPIFDALFGFEESVATALAELAAVCGISVIDARLVHRNNFSVWALVESAADQLHVTIRYHPARFDRAAAARIADEYVDLLERVVRYADRPIRLALASPAALTATRLSRAEQEARGAAWNQTREDFPRDACLHELLEARAAAAPEALAIVAGDERIDYRTLNERANRLARRLVALGAGVGCRVALLLERSPEWAIALVATLKTGAAYVPLDPSHPPARVQFMLHDSDSSIVITQHSLRSKAEGACQNIVDLDEAGAILARESGADLPVRVSPAHLSYVIYTSGTTGQPKGVMLDHVGRVNNFADFNRRFAVGPADRLLAVSSLSFDMSAYDVCGTLMAGAAIVLPVAAAERDASEWLRLIERDRVTIWHSTPALLELLIAECERHPPPPAARTLRLVLLGGDWIPVALADRVRAVFAGAEVTSLGGATEASMDSTIYRIGAVDPAWNSIPYGRPMANQTAYILDADLALTAPGVAGELHLGGIGLAWGYHRRPGLTAERFIPHPLSDAPGQRLYRTGDLARYDADGLIELLGRIDHQVKIHGVRIELEEIEAVLRRHPDVAKAVVVARQHQGRNHLAAYVVPQAWSAATCFRNAYTLPGGVRIAQQNKNETDYLYREIFEERTCLGPGTSLGEGACVFDVGANIGMFMLFVAAQVPNAKIYAFEPIPAIYANLAANAVSCPAEVRTFPIGLSDTERRESFVYYPRSSITSGMVPYASGGADRAKTEQFLANALDDGGSGAAELLQHADELLAGRFAGQHVTCELRRLSDVIREQGVSRIDLLKIDVERAELDVLHGIDEAVWPAIQQLVIEVHDRVEDHHSRLAQVVALLERRGFAVETVEDRRMRGTGVYNCYARRVAAGADLAASGAASAGRPALNRTALRAYLQQQLPPQLMPTEILLVPSLPVTANGKVDRRALSASESWAPILTPIYVAPRNPVEQVLEQLWSEVLRRGPIGVHDNYFDLGGDSLHTIRIAARAREHGVHLTPHLCFEHPTIAELAGALARSETDSKGDRP